MAVKKRPKQNRPPMFFFVAPGTVSVQTMPEVHGKMKSLRPGLFLVVFPLTLAAAQSIGERPVVPLSNWSAPRQVRRSELVVGRSGVSPQFQLAGSVATDALVFVPIAPCRLADTRSGSGYPALGSAPLSSLVAANLPVAGSCGVPAIGFHSPQAEAYSLNVTVVPPSGTPGGYLVVYPNPSNPVPLAASLTWTASALFQTAGVIVAASSDGSVNVAARFPTDVVIDINGYYAPPSDGAYNTGVGYDSLVAPTGGQNTAFGAFALPSDAAGVDNTAVGYAALNSNAAGNYNTAVGDVALQGTTTGSQNTAVGFGALSANTYGQNNVAVGASAGAYVTTGSFTISIGSLGDANDDHTIRIGDIQTSTYIAGIAAAPVTGAAVVVSSKGQLGVQLSSRRYKEDIQDMGDASSGLLRLRPVTFRYKRPNSDGTKPLDYGLIAEEVNDVFPELVVRGADGEIETVAYQKLPAMLLNELQKQYATIRDQQAQINQQGERLVKQEQENRKLEERLAAVEALVAGMTTSRTSDTASSKVQPSLAGGR